MDIFWIVVGSRGYILALGGWWGMLVDTFWLVVGGGGYTLTGGGGYILAGGGLWWVVA